MAYFGANWMDEEQDRLEQAARNHAVQSRGVEKLLRLGRGYGFGPRQLIGARGAVTQDEADELLKRFNDHYSFMRRLGAMFITSTSMTVSLAEDVAAQVCVDKSGPVTVLISMGRTGGAVDEYEQSFTTGFDAASWVMQETGIGTLEAGQLCHAIIELMETLG